MGEGLLQYSVEINYILNIIGRNDTFFYHVSVVAHVNDACKSLGVNRFKLHDMKVTKRQSDLFSSHLVPPAVSAFCTAQSIIFRMDHSRHAGLWEVCVGHQALTSDLSRLRGYILTNDSHSMTLEVPLFTSGYVYEAKKNICGSNYILIFIMS